MYGMGKGVEQNYVTAYAWASIAAANGEVLAAKFRSEFLEKKMTAEDISKAQELSKEMLKKNPKLIKKP
jgi:TPR repeat protein